MTTPPTPRRFMGLTTQGWKRGQNGSCVVLLIGVALLAIAISRGNDDRQSEGIFTWGTLIAFVGLFGVFQTGACMGFIKFLEKRGK